MSASDGVSGPLSSKGLAVAHGGGSRSGGGPDPSAGASPGRVLLVDDDPDIRQLVRLYLERVDGFEVVGEAADGREAIDLARQSRPDVVLLDVMMPGMSGHEAVPELLRVTPESMIVMLSALSAGCHEETALSAGAFAYVEKSTIDIEFGTQVRGLLDRFRHALSGWTVWSPDAPPR